VAIPDDGSREVRVPTLDVGGATLDYEVTGASGPLVVQLHGLTSSRGRDAQIGLDLARALHRDARVLRYDARGHGHSTGSPDPADYAWEHLAEDLLALLDHLAPDEKVHGIGTSMGCGTLLHAVLREPGRFASLTLVVPPTAWETRRAQSRDYLVNADLVEREGIDAFVELGLLSPTVPALADAPTTRPEVGERLLPTVLRGAAATDLPDPEALGRVRTPTLVLAWSDDPKHPLSTAALLHDVMPESRLVVARTPYGVMAWPGLFADHVTASDHATATTAVGESA
jgi:3-oxoadipate enol-lactonase